MHLIVAEKNISARRIAEILGEGKKLTEHKDAGVSTYTFGDINRLFNIPLEDLRVAFGLPSDADVAAFQAKSLEEMYSGLEQEIGTGSVRLFVAFYKGLPYELDSAEDTYLLPEAVEILQNQGRLLPGQRGESEDEREARYGGGEAHRGPPEVLH